jgi:hypothetical protein
MRTIANLDTRQRIWLPINRNPQLQPAATKVSAVLLNVSPQRHGDDR